MHFIVRVFISLNCDPLSYTCRLVAGILHIEIAKYYASLQSGFVKLSTLELLNTSGSNLGSFNSSTAFCKSS